MNGYPCFIIIVLGYSIGPPKIILHFEGIGHRSNSPDIIHHSSVFSFFESTSPGGWIHQRKHPTLLLDNMYRVFMKRTASISDWLRGFFSMRTENISNVFLGVPLRHAPARADHFRFQRFSRDWVKPSHRLPPTVLLSLSWLIQRSDKIGALRPIYLSVIRPEIIWWSHCSPRNTIGLPAVRNTEIIFISQSGLLTDRKISK
jgi:hypothetical protein